jgi:hypothetical protein
MLSTFPVGFVTGSIARTAAQTGYCTAYDAVLGACRCEVRRSDSLIDFFAQDLHVIRCVDRKSHLASRTGDQGDPDVFIDSQALAWSA